MIRIGHWNHMQFRNMSALLMGALLLGSLPLDARASGSLELGTKAGISADLDAAESEEVIEEAMNEVVLEAFHLDGYSNLGIVTVSEGKVNIRDAASMEGSIGMSALDQASALLKPVADVNTNGLKVRTEPNTECEVLDIVGSGQRFDVLEELDEWVKISLDGEEGYLFKEYVEVGAKLDEALTITEVRYGEGVSDVRMALCDFAKQYVGRPYVWGGTSLTKGADCSGFVLSVFRNYGISLSHSSRVQANSGSPVSLSELKPGDLVFYGNGSGINHVAIYIGGGQVVHASSPQVGITISSMYYRTPVRARRIIQD